MLSESLFPKPIETGSQSLTLCHLLKWKWAGMSTIRKCCRTKKFQLLSRPGVTWTGSSACNLLTIHLSLTPLAPLNLSYSNALVWMHSLHNLKNFSNTIFTATIPFRVDAKTQLIPATTLCPIAPMKRIHHI